MVGWNMILTFIAFIDARFAFGSICPRGFDREFVSFLKCYDVIRLTSAYRTPERKDPENLHFQGSYIVNFTAFGTAFSVFLRRTELSTLIDRSATIKRNDVISPLDELTYYDGHVIGFEGASEVHGSLHNDIFHGVMRCNSSTLYLEAADNFVPSAGSSDVIAYRTQDLLSPKPEGIACVGAGLERERVLVPGGQGEGQRSRRTRRKRNNRTHRFCTAHLVADVQYLESYARGDAALALQEMLFQIKEANAIFQATDFDSDGFADGVGLLIANVTFIDKIDSYNYSEPRGTAFMDSIKNQFDFRGVCIGIIWTFQNMRDTLGMSYISNKYNMATGIYSAKFNHLFVNPNMWGKVAPRAMFTITVAHELGHSFGANHDPGDRGAPCSPFDKDGGTYLMYPVVSSGRMSNNRRFSSCSIANITAVIKSRNIYLSSIPSPYCGNGLVEGNEECDCGTAESCDKIDPCCEPGPATTVTLGRQRQPCTFRRWQSAHCSPRTMPCCTRDCAVVSADERRICSIYNECTHVAVCDGLQPTCPHPQPLRENTSCAAGTKVCQSGECVGSVCALTGLVDCTCGNGTHECVLCCRDSPGGPCRPAEYFPPFGRQRVPLPAGSHCADGKGYCDTDGICQGPGGDVPFDGTFVASAIDLFQSQWQFILPCVITLLVFYGAHIIRPRADRLDSKAFRSGRIAKAYFRAQSVYHRIRRLLRAVDEGCGSDEYSAAAAVPRLRALFPGTPTSTVYWTVVFSASEVEAVSRLIILGYPMIKILTVKYLRHL